MVTVTASGSGVDTITISDAITTLDVDAGNDIITTTAADAEAFSVSGHSLDFGAGTDTLVISDATTGLVDADFANVTATTLTNITLASYTANTVVLGSSAKSAGVVSITAAGTGIDTITLHDGVTTVDTDAGADIITIPAAGLEAAPTIDGGAQSDLSLIHI